MSAASRVLDNDVGNAKISGIFWLMGGPMPSVTGKSSWDWPSLVGVFGGFTDLAEDILTVTDINHMGRYGDVGFRWYLPVPPGLLAEVEAWIRSELQRLALYLPFVDENGDEIHNLLSLAPVHEGLVRNVFEMAAEAFGLDPSSLQTSL